MANLDNYYNNREKILKQQKEYVVINAYDKTKRYVENHPLRVQAHRKLNWLITKGEITSQPCKCGELKTEAHHEDYNKPYDIIWMCRKCHKILHRKRGVLSIK